MPINYVTQFSDQILQLYASDLCSVGLYNSNPSINIVNTKYIRLPSITTSGYKDHNRNVLNYNTGVYGNEFKTKTLDHDRNIEFFIDPMDVDETNQVLSIQNIQTDFEQRQAIPELDCYTFSKIHSELKKVAPEHITETELKTSNILEKLDKVVEQMENDSVPMSRCILYCTSSVKRILKNADEIRRNLDVSSGNALDRRIISFEDFGDIVTVPINRFKTEYNFTDGFVADPMGTQINYMIIDPEAQVSRVKHSYIQFYAPGSDSRCADKYLYQNRRYNGTFGIDGRLEKGCYINIAKGGKA